MARNDNGNKKKDDDDADNKIKNSIFGESIQSNDEEYLSETEGPLGCQRCGSWRRLGFVQGYEGNLQQGSYAHYHQQF